MAVTSQFPTLLSPLSIRHVQLRNRVAMLPMGSRQAELGVPSPGDIAYYRARAKGGVGLVITGGTVVHPTSMLPSRHMFEAFNRDAVPGFRDLADAVHAEGAKIFGQLFHRGRETLGDITWPTWAPSAIASPGDPQIPHEMTADEIDQIIEAFAVSAANLCEAGYDGVEIHSAHGYLVGQFLSLASNHRSDLYGDTFKNRMRFLMDIVGRIRGRCGDRPVLGVRLSAEEGIDDGLTLADTKAIAIALKQEGLVDYLSITLGIKGTYVRDMSTPVGVVAPLAKAVRAVAGLPVIVAQRITHPTLAEQLLVNGVADLVGLARALLADAEWVCKTAENRLDEIRPCVGCVQDCRSGATRCLHNPDTGRELLWPSLPQAANRRRVVVVGGGPAGMEAARVAAARGHELVLFESGSRLGGQVLLAARAPNRAELDGVISWREAELKRRGVDIRLGREANADSVLAESPDYVVIATGARPRTPEVTGSTLPHVMTVWDLFGADDADARLAGATSAAVIDDGSGFWEACSSAEHLAAKGLKVRLLTRAHAIAGAIPEEAIGPLLVRLRRLGVEFLTMTGVVAIEPGRLITYDIVRLQARHSLEEKAIEADVVVAYSGKCVNDSLATALRGHCELSIVGDCFLPRHISQAILEGHMAGRSI